MFSSSHRVHPSSMFPVHGWYRAIRGFFTSRHPARDSNEKSPDPASRHTDRPDFHARFTAVQVSVSAAFHTGPAAAAGAFHSPDAVTAVPTAFTSTPISSGRI